jgi:xanthosine utilization system XapX-like protein
MTLATRKQRAVVWVLAVLATGIVWALVNSVLHAPSFIGMLVGLPVGAGVMLWVLDAD